MTATLTPAQEAARMVDSLGPEALAKAQAYTTGNHWVLLGGVLVSVLVAVIMVCLKLLDRIAAPMLGYWGLCDPHGQPGDHPFPAMKRWLR